ncbi:MAG: DUF1961 family protein, partial [Oscillospiraceae bacterium]
DGQNDMTFPNGRLRMENSLDPELGQKSNFVAWLPLEVPSSFMLTYDFFPIKEPGLCMLMFAARAINGNDIFHESVAKRNGEYDCYGAGDINLLHLAYFRRRYENERAFHTCNLRKSNGFHLAAMGGDPIPNVEDCTSPYKIKLIKDGARVSFFINDLLVIDWFDDGTLYGEPFKGGKIGLRQMAPFIGEYENLKIYTTL